MSAGELRNEDESVRLSIALKRTTFKLITLPRLTVVAVRIPSK